MEKNSFWNNTFVGYTLKNILIAIAVFIGLVWITLILIDFYTNHGDTHKVPGLKGVSIEQAVKMLDKLDLKAEVIDSVYVKDQKLGTVIEQNPAEGSIVKPGRPIYLIVNSRSVRLIALPQVADLSLRQAEATLQSVGIHVSSIQYAPSEYKDLVLGVKYRGQNITRGTKIPEGSTVVLVAGNGYGAAATAVPAVMGMNLSTAIEIINASSFVVGGVIYDLEPDGDEESYLIYDQRPAPGDSVSAGGTINLWLSKDPNKKAPPKVKKQQVEEEKVEDIEDFF
ncbi:MAG TPA: PASTA domain-containing protein [Paludibacteraceae bacterium]|nr:PASTA domain-containing protein [Paludibacteraceae bacterium]HPT43020.1 PASTA domain-containing protein [Paludibacteraceae bacterium]